MHQEPNERNPKSKHIAWELRARESEKEKSTKTKHDRLLCLSNKTWKEILLLS